MPDLISALKDADQYNLEEITKDITKEVFCGLKVIPDDVKCTTTFKTLPYNLISEIFLFKLDSWTLLDLWGQIPSTKQKLDSFMIWLSENEITDEQKEEIVESFKFDDFTVEELTTTVRKSCLYPDIAIDKRVLELFQEQEKEKDKLLKDKENHIKVLNTFKERGEQKDELIRKKDKLLKEKDKLIKEKDKLIRTKDKLLKFP